MNRRITIFVASHSGGPVRQMTMSRRSVAGVALLVGIVLLLSGYIAFGYFALQKKTLRARQLSEAIASQQQALGEQRQQIEALTGRINEMKSRLFGLNEFERKIRIIADINDKQGSSGLLGMGGPLPEDIFTQIELEKEQNALIREMHSHLNQLETAFSTREQSLSVLLGCLMDKRQLLAATPAIRPVNGGWITSRFEYRKSPFTGQREFHQGLDIAAGMDTPIMAPADGEVVFSGYKGGGLGITIEVDHGRGIVTRYAHLSKYLKKQGDFVKREQIIGTVGNTGQSTGPHLHYEVRVNGVPVNPEKYILN